VSLIEYQQAIDWLSVWIRGVVGDVAVEAQLIPEWEYWLFYADNGDILVRVRHEDIERLTVVFAKQWEQSLDAQIDALMKEPKREW
jgi:hypothetical protein